MKVIVREKNNQLTYQLDGHDLPENSAIHEYKHPDDVTYEAWQDLAELANGDLLIVTYIGTNPGFKLFSQWAPKESTTIRLRFVDYAQKLVQKFESEFSEWLDLIRNTDAYRSAVLADDPLVEIKRIEETYTGLAVMNNLVQYGRRMIQEIMPEKLEPSLSGNWNATMNKLSQLAQEKENLRQDVTSLKKVMAKGLATSENESMQNLVQWMLATAGVAQKQADSFRDGERGAKLSESDSNIRRYRMTLIKIMESFQTKIVALTSDLKVDPQINKKVDRILRNVEFDQVNVKSVQLQAIQDKSQFTEACTALLEKNQKLQTSQSTIDRLLANVRILIISLAQVVNVSLENQQLIDNQRVLKEDRLDQQKRLKLLTQKIVIVEQKIQRAQYCQQQLLELRNIEKRLPIITL
ncbi:hypothetical protein DA798_11005 [Lactobacillus sp. PFC-70]|nr:hypothetical protein DA798_11005 [Lactobacillus sp. PFC-70]